MRIRFDYVERKTAGSFHSYGKFVSRNPAPFIIAPLLFTMAMVAGFFHLDPVTDAIYLFTPSDAPSKMERMAIPHYHILQDHFWKYGATLQVVANNAPDLRMRSERERVMQLAHEMSTTSHSAGEESLQFWMLEMTNYYKTQLEMDLVDVAFYGMLQHYLSAKPKPWIEDVLWNKTAGSDDLQIIQIPGRHARHRLHQRAARGDSSVQIGRDLDDYDHQVDRLLGRLLCPHHLRLRLLSPSQPQGQDQRRTSCTRMATHSGWSLDDPGSLCAGRRAGLHDRHFV
ncbi:hypothetical protein PMAYCL1PPCAC_21923 [Pristionchus mayeri]|uniref:Uncharacterized protein n=1 Tax=Pristionchus mayeri TaxID=1317129 RepID=A0AAN5CVS7_9BILA|nr:hypothetical protein PMAYCL1PPCAC_21923 [Pristionchus mayeri]